MYYGMGLAYFHLAHSVLERNEQNNCDLPRYHLREEWKSQHQDEDWFLIEDAPSTQVHVTSCETDSLLFPLGLVKEVLLSCGLLFLRAFFQTHHWLRGFTLLRSGHQTARCPNSNIIVLPHFRTDVLKCPVDARNHQAHSTPHTPYIHCDQVLLIN